jgi:Zn-dependent protease with chaperone function
VTTLVFPLTALAALFLGVMPITTLIAQALLARRRARLPWRTVGDHATFALLVTPTLLPLAWFASAALHQSEPARAIETCLIEHLGVDHCIDAVALLALLFVGIVAVTVRRIRVERVGFVGHPLPPDDPRQHRIDALCRARPALARRRVAVVREAPAPAFVHGWLAPRIVLDAAFVDAETDDRVLAAVLLHEAAHADARDPLRSFGARLCLALNPAGGRLRAELSHWQQAREIACDIEAVTRGGDPLALAQGIVRAARRQNRAPGRTPCRSVPALAPLCGHEPAALRLRIALLLEPIPPAATDRSHRLLLIAVIVAALAPHLIAPGAFESFHHLVERLVLDAPL